MIPKTRVKASLIALDTIALLEDGMDSLHRATRQSSTPSPNNKPLQLHLRQLPMPQLRLPLQQPLKPPQAS